MAGHRAGEADHAELEAALGRIAHRGPDGTGTAIVGEAWLGHRRLAIVDVAGGDQPLHAGGAALVGNGEIYNHEELRARLRGPFTTGSDNEAILRLLVEEGPGALASLRGMYAFCMATPAGDFVAARDPVGIKPLYWAKRGGETRFASELRAFPSSWLPDVEAFPPGCSWTPERGLQRFTSVDQPFSHPALAAADDADDADEAVVALLRETVSTAVERRMMADVGVGVFLSGGLDSSIVAAVAARHAAARGQRLTTFAVGTPDSPDLAAARLVAAHLGTDHHERITSPEEAVAVLGDVVDAIEAYEPSLVRSAVPNYLLAELAARHVKVVLTGEGADELFAGYAYHAEIDGSDALHDELVRTVASLHNLNLQRCDRVTMAHGLEARVPFLDLDVIGLGLAMPARWKVPGPGRMEKHLLRHAFADLLPDEIVWRTKAQFGDGSGARDVLAAHAAAHVDGAELAAAQALDDPPPRSAEELLYRGLFRERFEGLRDDRVLGRFATA